MALKITLCRCYFGGETCNYCGSSGVIIEDTPDENKIENQKNTGKYLKNYYDKLHLVNENIQNNRYNRNIILNNIKKLHDAKTNNLELHEKISPVWLSCEHEYKNIIQNLINIQSEEPIRLNELYLFDIVHYNQEYYFFSLKNECKSQSIEFIFVNGDKIKKCVKTTKDIYNLIRIKKATNNIDTSTLIANDFHQLSIKDAFKSLIFIENTMPKVKFYFYKANEKKGYFYYLDWVEFIMSLGITL
jgi:hypothetical protein